MTCTTPVELSQLIQRRATFTRGARCIAACVADSASLPDGITAYLPLVHRVHSLLKARYSDTSIEAWRAGQHLFSTCVQYAGQLPAADASKFKAYLGDAQRVLQADSEVPASAQGPVQLEQLHPADILLGLGPSAAVPVSHYDDAGPIVDDAVRWARAQRSGTPGPEPAPSTGQAETQPATATQQGDNAATAATTAPTVEARRELQQQILEGLQAVFEGVAAVTSGTEAVERELEQVLTMMRERAEASGRRATPPMSQKVFNALPVVELSAETLSELGQDARCPICTDAFAVGDRVFMLPCKGKHWYHPACVEPWLSKTNSCPVCREELPTDDPHYEADKELQAEQAAERAGAANALSHNEFMYI